MIGLNNELMNSVCVNAHEREYNKLIYCAELI